MRFFLSALAWLLMFGGLSLYIYQRDQIAPVPIQAPAQQAVAQADFTLEITPTFSPEPDPFALQVDDDATAPLVVRIAGQELFRAETLDPGMPVRLHPVPGLVEGRNELYLQGQPPVGEAGRSHAVRLRLLQGTRVLVDETLWAPGGAIVSGTIPFTLEETTEDEHDH